jgi:serine/threonine-protein kinase
VSQSYSLNSERGTVLSQDPLAEASVPANSAVNIAVSQGPPPSGVSLMPDFERKNAVDAQKWAEGAGIKIALTKDYNSLFPYGVILSQTPPPDAVLSPDTTVSFTISGQASGSSASPASKVFHYELSQGSSESRVRIVVVDQYGEREIFDGVRPPGSKIDVPLEEAGSARVKIYVDGILIEERDL